jgi:hypothetical protein
MMCKICNQESKNIFSAIILGHYNINYFYCDNCGFLFTEKPYWLKEAYNSPINISDTGIINRNINFSIISSNIIYYFFDYEKTFLDYAGGYGIFVRLMRDIGFNFKWQDNFSQNLVARGFEYCQNDRIDLITIFEAFEHFVDPIEEIEKILRISKNILFSTTLLPEKIPNPHDWWYYGLNHGQHVSFYSLKTFKYLAKKYNLNYYSDGKLVHLLTEKKINPILFKLFISRFKIIFWLFIKIKLKSKIWNDYSFLNKN